MGISSEDMPESGCKIEGKYGTYIIKEKIGNGGNGTVFFIDIIRNQKELLCNENGYVIKILTINNIKYTEETRKKREERFRREVSAVS